ncbi:hypothetical protein [Streptococcus salivarius]|uniref:hypothetical protein n=1 Tax=Streptococcus salivarius TaxID=1304 RepID=UPI00093891B5|nr:hypothetical protein [Streptococcus salivarius]PCR82932.1 hypothetical protein CQA85_04790 [Streptococcus salivarius]
MTDEVMTKKNIYLVSDVDKAKKLEAYIVSTKDGMEVFGLIGCDELEELTDDQRDFVQSGEAMRFKSN